MSGTQGDQLRQAFANLLQFRQSLVDRGQPLFGSLLDPLDASRAVSRQRKKVADFIQAKAQILHATNEAKLTKKAFEYAFRAASVAAGRSAFITTSQTNPGADVTVDGVAFSLKTEAAAGMRADRITISKLSEARWIQQCATLEELAQATATRIPAHLQKYERILTLRARSLSPIKVQYELIEIPRAVLLQVRTLTAADFSPRTPQGGSSASVKLNGGEAFTLRLDGSDGKVTITNLHMSVCIRHCDWAIPTVTAAPDDLATDVPPGVDTLFGPA